MGARISEDERRIAHTYARRTIKENISVKDIATIAHRAGIFPNRSWKAIQVMICQERQKIDPNVKRKKDEPAQAVIPIEEPVPDDGGKQCSMFDRIELDEQTKAITVRALRILVKAVNEVIEFMEEY